MLGNVNKDFLVLLFEVIYNLLHNQVNCYWVCHLSVLSIFCHRTKMIAIINVQFLNHYYNTMFSTD